MRSNYFLQLKHPPVRELTLSYSTSRLFSTRLDLLLLLQALEFCVEGLDLDASVGLKVLTELTYFVAAESDFGGCACDNSFLIIILSPPLVQKELALTKC